MLGVGIVAAVAVVAVEVEELVALSAGVAVLLPSSQVKLPFMFVKLSEAQALRSICVA